MFLIIEIFTQLHPLYLDKAKPASLFFARFRLDRSSFLQEMIIDAYEQEGTTPIVEVLSDGPGLKDKVTDIVLTSSGYELGKKIRWFMETSCLYGKAQGIKSRNSIFLNFAQSYFNQDPRLMDLLQEYFVPKEYFSEFVDLLRVAIPASRTNMLNITVRDIKADLRSLLSYSKRDCYSFVMYFREQRSEKSFDKLRDLFGIIYPWLLDHGGSYYLPYTPLATKEIFNAFYPRATEFLDRKMVFDPEERFSNQFYLDYLAVSSSK